MVSMSEQLILYIYVCVYLLCFVQLFFLKDEFPVVRARAVRSLTAIFEPIREVPDGYAPLLCKGR